MHPEAQRHLSKLIGHLHEQLGIQLVALEGADGLCDTTLYSDFPDPPSTKRIASLFLQEGIFTGAEHYAITHPGEVTLWGVEDEALYRQHLATYQQGAMRQAEAEPILKRLREHLTSLRNTLYPEALHRLLQLRDAYERDEDHSFQPYMTELQRLANAAKLDLTVYPQYLAYLQRSEQIRFGELTDELDALDEAVEEEHVTTEPQRTLARLIRQVALLDDLLHVKLSPARHRQYQRDKSTLTAQALAIALHRVAPQAPVTIVDLQRLMEAIPTQERFYELAMKRDQAFVDNTLHRLEEHQTKAAILIAGGFHTPGIMTYLKEQNVAYVVVTPRVDGQPDELRYHAGLGNALPPLADVLRKVDQAVLQTPLSSAQNSPPTTGKLPNGPVGRHDSQDYTLPKRDMVFLYWLNAQITVLGRQFSDWADRLQSWIKAHPREAAIYGIALTLAAGTVILSAMGVDMQFDQSDGTLLAMATVGSFGEGGREPPEKQTAAPREQPPGLSQEISTGLSRGFPRFTLGNTEELASRTASYDGQEISGLMVNPNTGRLVTSKLWQHPDTNEWPFHEASRFSTVTATLYERVNAPSSDILWFDDRYVPVVGDEIYHADGTPLTEQELTQAGLRKVVDSTGVPRRLRLLATGNRVFALPGPWVVPSTKEGNSIRILTTLQEVSQLTGTPVTFETLPQVLQELAGRGLITLRVAAVLEFKGIGAAKLSLQSDASEILRPLNHKPIYMPAGDFRRLTGRTDPVGGGVGAISNEEAQAVENDRALRREGAELLADTVAAYQLFSETALPELTTTVWKEAWYSVRLTYDTTRIGDFTYQWSDSPPEAKRSLAETYYRELFAIEDKQPLAPAVLSRLLHNLASNLRALWMNRLQRTWTSDVVDNYGPLMELIDTGSDSLKPFETDQDARFFFSQWGSYPLYFVEAIVRALTYTSDQPYDAFDTLVRHPTFREDFLVPLLVDRATVEQAHRAFLAALQERPRYEWLPSAMDMDRFAHLTHQFLLQATSSETLKKPPPGSPAAVFDILAQAERLTPQDIARQLKRSWRTVERDLSPMVARGLVRRDGPPKSPTTPYELTPTARAHLERIQRLFRYELPQARPTAAQWAAIEPKLQAILKETTSATQSTTLPEISHEAAAQSSLTADALLTRMEHILRIGPMPTARDWVEFYLLQLHWLRARGVLTKDVRVFDVLTGASLFPGLFVAEMWTSDRRLREEEMRESFDRLWQTVHSWSLPRLDDLLPPQGELASIHHDPSDILKDESFIPRWTGLMRSGDVVMLRFTAEFLLGRGATSGQVAAWLDRFASALPEGVRLVIFDYKPWEGGPVFSEEGVPGYLVDTGLFADITTAGLSLQDVGRVEAINRDFNLQRHHQRDAVLPVAGTPDLNVALKGRLTILRKTAPSDPEGGGSRPSGSPDSNGNLPALSSPKEILDHVRQSIRTQDELERQP